jgi:hypothetical protein
MREEWQDRAEEEMRQEERRNYYTEERPQYIESSWDYAIMEAKYRR